MTQSKFFLSDSQDTRSINDSFDSEPSDSSENSLIAVPLTSNIHTQYVSAKM